MTALADVMDALINTRPNHSGMPGSTALQIIRDGRGTHFDPELTDKFLGFVDELQQLIRRHVAITDFSAATWTGENVRMVVRTDGGDFTVLLRNTPQGWEWVSAYPIMTAEAAGAGA